MVDLDSLPSRIRDGLLGQEAALERWDRAFSQNRLAHAYLLLGARGSGRLRLGLALAQQLLCEGPDAPCGACAGCRKTAHLTHPDLHLVLPLGRDEADDGEARAAALGRYARGRYERFALTGSTGIDRVREVKEEVSKALVEAAHRVVLFVSVDRMTEQAAQSALKLVEEPPPATTLLLTAEDPAQLLPTLVSRCQRIAVAPLPRETLAGMLETEMKVPAKEAPVLAALAGGSLGRALEIRDGGVLEMRDRILAVFAVGAESRTRGGSGSGIGPREVERRVAALERGWNAETARRAAELLLIWYRDIVAAGSGLGEEHLAHSDRAEEARRAAAALGVSEIARRMRIVEEMVRAVDQNVNPALALHVALGRIASGSEIEDVPA